MRLIESVASYSAAPRELVRQYLTDDVKASLIDLVRTPAAPVRFGDALLAELIEMDVLAVDAGRLRPNTAIFLAEDFAGLYEPIQALGAGIAAVVRDSAAELAICSPNVRNFVGGIMGMNQGLHTILRGMGLTQDWQAKTGRYARTKVDLNEDCPEHDRFGPDLQTKRVHRGELYTSVTIGAGADGFAPGEIVDPSSVIDAADAEAYQQTITRISAACADYYTGAIEQIQALLAATLVGKQGVPLQNLTLNFWRLLRRTAAAKLYENGFLTDRVPLDGSITVFYENTIPYFG